MSQLVGWCFKPSQPQGITSGLIINYDRTVIIFAFVVEALTDYDRTVIIFAFVVEALTDYGRTVIIFALVVEVPIDLSLIHI